MRKNALTICSFVCAFGAFGAFFRWLQNQIGFDPVTNVSTGSTLNFILPLVLVIAAVVFYAVIRKYLGGLRIPGTMYGTFRGTTLLHAVAAWFIAFIMIVGGLITVFSISADGQPKAHAFIGIFAILSGLGFPVICTAAKKRYSPALVSILSVFPIIMYGVWLVACYIRNASVPSIMRFAVEILTVCVVLIALYYDAGYPFGVPKPTSALYFSMLGAFMCIVSFADGRPIGHQVIIAGTAGMLLMYCWMIVSNMRKPSDEPEEVQPEPEVPVEERFFDVDAEPVIPAGAAAETPEPTFEAPDKK